MAYETPSGTIDGVNTVFNALNTITFEQIFVDRILQVKGVDYTLSGTTITFQAGSIPLPGALLRIYYSPGGSAAQTGSTRFDTAGNIINDVAAEVGLATVADPFVSTDPNFIQLKYLLKSAGRMLTFDSDWTQLRGEYVFTTVANQTQYTLPPDYNNMIDQTGWNRTNRLPIGGPLSPQEWQYFKARLTGVVFNVLFRQMQQRWFLFPDTTTPAAFTIGFEYNSKWWVGGALAVTPKAWTANTVYSLNDQVTVAGQPYYCVIAGTSSNVAGATGPVGFGCVLDGTVIWKWQDPFGVATSDQPTASTDTIYFDTTLMSRRLKRDFLLAKGFDSAAASQEYQAVLDQIINSDRPATVLNLRGRPPFDPLLGAQSVPITGYGQ